MHCNSFMLIKTILYLQPYAWLLSNKEVFELIHKGERLPKPSICPDNIYDLMKNCWNESPELRPSFEMIFKHI